MELQDDYEHVSEEIFYITENIAAAQHLEQELEEQIARGCVCEKQCNAENNCACVASSGLVYKKRENEPDDSYFIEETDANTPMYECNNSCKCLGKCGHRLVQFGPRKNLQITKTGEKGFGLVTNVAIRKGSFICEYAGEIISESEAKNRYRNNKSLQKMNYIFCVNEYFGDRNCKTYIDPSLFGNIGRYINHSCEPNCVLYPVRVNSVVPKLCIFAKTDIGVFCEITFDYGGGKWDNTTNRIVCKCNTPCCRKYLPYCPEI